MGVVLEAQNHPWLKSTGNYSPPVLQPSILTSIQEFQGYNHLKKAALTAVAYHLNNVGKERGVHGRTS